ncbi:ATP-dependent DNA ligase [Candidatus Bathyarchaeota archaeon]|nr:ATP-dependent DNA ligase [Candidatus Bathyarchaeota archaeon]
MPMLFMDLCKVLARIEKTSKRLEMMSLFQEIFQSDPNELVEDDEPIHDKLIYLCQGKLHPDWHGMPELNMAKKMVLKATARAVGVSPSRITEILKKSGDLGNTMGYLKKKKQQSTLFGKEEPMTITTTWNELERIANATGENSQSKKMRILSGILARCSPLEAKYIGRFIESKMRLGMADLTMIDAISRIFASDDEQQKECKAILERGYNIYPDLGTIVKKAFIEGMKSIKQISPVFGIPIRPMLAQRLEASAGFIDKHGGSFAAEYKLDGERLQIHKDGKDIILFSRRLENITNQFPDAIRLIQDCIKPVQAILDAEIVAINPETGKIDTFQVLMQRKRKHDIAAFMQEVPIRIYIFDAMMLDGRSLLEEPYLKRREIVENSIDDEKCDGNIVAVEQSIINNHDELIAFFERAIMEGTEGLVTKSIAPDSTYQPGARGWLWIKLKSLADGKLPDTLDLAIIGVNWGEGRRAGRFGSFFLGAMNHETGNLEMITKVSSGITDELADILYNDLNTVEDIPPNVISVEQPDKWVIPTMIVEIAGDQVTSSDGSTTGFSIRFPRILRLRKDKKIEDISTVDDIKQMA